MGHDQSRPSLPRPPHRTRLKPRLVVIVGSLLGVAMIAVWWFHGPPAGGPGGPVVPETVEVAVTMAFDERRCTTAAEAERSLQESLEESGYTDWSVLKGPALRSTTCVGASVDTLKKHVVLVAVLSPEARQAMQRVTEDLYSRCLSKQEAIEHVTSVLRGLGEADFGVQTDGPLTAPLGREDEILDHVAAGCWVYSGTGTSTSGQRTYFLSGRDP